jgi:hypothetical protein
VSRGIYNDHGPGCIARANENGRAEGQGALAGGIARAEAGTEAGAEAEKIVGKAGKAGVPLTLAAN